MDFGVQVDGSMGNCLIDCAGLLDQSKAFSCSQANRPTTKRMKLQLRIFWMDTLKLAEYKDYCCIWIDMYIYAYL